MSFKERTKILVATTDEELQPIREGAAEPSYNTTIQVWDRVDMARDVVVAIIMLAPTPYAGPGVSPVEIVDVCTLAATAHIFVRIHKNPPGTVIEQIVTYPYVIIAIPKLNIPQEGDVRFIVDTTEGDRFAETMYPFQSK